MYVLSVMMRAALSLVEADACTLVIAEELTRDVGTKYPMCQAAMVARAAALTTSKTRRRHSAARTRHASTGTKRAGTNETSSGAARPSEYDAGRHLIAINPRHASITSHKIKLRNPCRARFGRRLGF